jgi:nucleoside-diphosphate-sugar epimerase
MEITITGGAGYIGSATCAHLLARGHMVTVLDALVYGAESLLAFAHHPRFRLLRGDVRNTALLSDAFERADAILHLAAIVGEPACQIDESTAWSVNLEGVRSALEAYRRSSAGRFLFVSTCSNYGIATETIATEETALNPLSLYAKSKVEAERLVLAEGREVCIFRFGTICGLSPRMRFDLLLNDMARAAAKGRPMSLFAPEAWRPLLDIHDAGRAIETYFNAEPCVGRHRVFNVVTENIRKRDLFDLVRRHFPDALINIAERATDPRDYRVSGDRIAQELGYRPAGSLEQTFLSVAQSVSLGSFRQPFWEGHAAVPLDESRLLYRPALSASKAGNSLVAANDR